MDLKKGVASVALAVSMTLASAGDLDAAAARLTSDVDADLAENARDVFARNCVGCHNPNRVGFDRDIGTTITDGNATPHYYVSDFLPNSDKHIESDTIKAYVSSGYMPLFRDALDNDDMQVILDWVDAGRPSWELELDVDPELDRIEKALSFTMNSLSWEPQVVNVERVSEYVEGYYYRYFTVGSEIKFRVDLRSYGWDSDKWRLVTKSDTIDAEDFVSRVTQGSLYYELLLGQDWRHLNKLYETLNEHYGNEISRSVIDANFETLPDSGVSPNTREVSMVELDTDRYYWESGDFREKRTDKDGGEMIWNLPNGFQAYMIIDYRHNLLVEAPLDIVRDLSDPNKDDTIKVGVSCMGCHSAGMIRFDYGLDHVLGQAQDVFADALSYINVRSGDPNPVKELLRPADSAPSAPSMMSVHSSPVEVVGKYLTTWADQKRR